MSCPVLFIIQVARNSLKPVAELKREFVLPDEKVLHQTWKDRFHRDFSNRMRRRGKAGGNRYFADGESLQSN